jgi:hypothetical protein
LENKCAAATLALGLLGTLVFAGDVRALGPNDHPATILHVAFEFLPRADLEQTLRGPKWKSAAERKIVREINNYARRHSDREPWPWKLTDAPFVEGQRHAQLTIVLASEPNPWKFRLTCRFPEWSKTHYAEFDAPEIGDFVQPTDPEIEQADTDNDGRHAFNKVAYDFAKYCLEPREKVASGRFRRLLSETIAIGGAAILFDKTHPNAVPRSALVRAKPKLRIGPPVGILWLNWDNAENIREQELTVETMSAEQSPDRFYSQGSGFAFFDFWKKRVGLYVRHIEFSESPISPSLTPINLTSCCHAKYLRDHSGPIYRSSVYLGVPTLAIHQPTRRINELNRNSDQPNQGVRAPVSRSSSS